MPNAYNVFGRCQAKKIKLRRVGVASMIVVDKDPIVRDSSEAETAARSIWIFHSIAGLMLFARIS
jgi:hypothetical protein